jgi:hypothetical protein
MHPVLANAVCPFAELVATVSLGEAQLSPDPEHHQWCAQQVMEHLLLSFQRSIVELKKRLASGNSPARRASLLQGILASQVCFWGHMPRGVFTSLAIRPGEFVPQDGKQLAARFLAAAEDVNKVLDDCRLSFGMRPCGYHPMYGPLRVEEWRVYHAVHCRLHQQQFEEAIRFARRQLAAGTVQAAGGEKPTDTDQAVAGEKSTGTAQAAVSEKRTVTRTRKAK